MKDGIAHVQAGGGVVADSVADYEDNESLNKARTVLSAVAAAQTMVAAGELDPAADAASV
jgi:anthranilate synthase component 1